MEEEIDLDSLSEEQRNRLEKWTKKKAKLLLEKKETNPELKVLGEVKTEKQTDYSKKRRIFSDDSKYADVRIMGKYMLRDMPLFKFEFIIYLIMLVVAFMFYVLDRIGIVEGALAKLVIPALILPLGIWFVKRTLYMPTKKRVPSMRIYKSGVIELGVQDISKGFVEWGIGPEKLKKYITRLTKHTEASTGKPFIITAETRGENISLLEGTEPDMRSEEFNAILENQKAVVTKKVMNEMLSTVRPKLNNPMFLLLAANLALVVVLLVKSFGFFEMIKGG